MRLKEWLFHHSMSIKAFAYLMGTSRTYVQHWFTGLRPSVKFLTKVRMFTNGQVSKFQDLLEPGRMEFKKHAYVYRKRVYKSKKKFPRVRKSLIPKMPTSEEVDPPEVASSGQ